VPLWINPQLRIITQPMSPSVPEINNPSRSIPDQSIPKLPVCITREIHADEESFTEGRPAEGFPVVVEAAEGGECGEEVVVYVGCHFLKFSF